MSGDVQLSGMAAVGQDHAGPEHRQRKATQVVCLAEKHLARPLALAKPTVATKSPGFTRMADACLHAPATATTSDQSSRYETVPKPGSSLLEVRPLAMSRTTVRARL